MEVVSAWVSSLALGAVAVFGSPKRIGVGTSLAYVVFLVLEFMLFSKVTSPTVDLILANLPSLLDRNHPSQHLHRR